MPPDTRRPLAFPFALAPALALSLVGLQLVSCTGSVDAPAAGRADTVAGEPGPVVAPDVVFRTLTGERLTLAAASGPTLVAFWATSCGVCLHEMPDLARVRADYASRGFELVAVAMPYDRPDRVLELVESRGWDFPVALDIDGRVLAAFEPVPGTPTSFLIDADGRVLERRVGAVDIGALRTTLDRLLAAAPGTDTDPSRT